MTTNPAAICLALILLGLIYWRTRLGPLDLTIRALMHFQAAVHGLGAEIGWAAVRWVRRHRRRHAEIRRRYAT